MIGSICREYRLSKGVSLAALASNTANYKTLYSFEQNKSTNFNHIKPYVKLADKLGEVDIFLLSLLRELRNGKSSN